jgi:hypothetical protein
VVFLTYSAAVTKLPWYVMPIYPAASVLIANLLLEAYRTIQNERVAAFLPGRGQAALVSVLVAGCGGLLVAGMSTLPGLFGNEQSAMAQAGRRVYSQVDPADRPLLIFSGLYEPTVLFYADRPVLSVDSLQTLDAVVDGSGEVPIVLRDEDVGTLQTRYRLRQIADAQSVVLGIIARQSATSASSPTR